MIRLCAFALTLAFSSDGFSQNLDRIIFRAFDADTNEQVDAAFTVDGVALDQGQYTLRQNQESTIAIEVVTDAGNEYHNRKFNLFLGGYSRKQISMYVYLAKKKEGVVYSRGSVNQAMLHLASTPDRVVALLERIQGGTPIHLMSTQFGVNFRYNLGRAYYQNCTLRGVDSCDMALALFRELRNEMDKNSFLFDRERIDEKSLATADFDRQRLVNIYRRAKWDFRRGEIEAAKDSFQALITEADAGRSDVFDLIQVSRTQVEADLALVEGRLKDIVMDQFRPVGD